MIGACVVRKSKQNEESYLNLKPAHDKKTQSVDRKRDQKNNPLSQRERGVNNKHGK
jgi:hypothetical protein